MSNSKKQINSTHYNRTTNLKPTQNRPLGGFGALGGENV